MTTPFSQHPDRTATIALTKDEEAFVRGDAWSDSPVVRMILAKLRHSLEVTDILLRPVGDHDKTPSG